MAAVIDHGYTVLGLSEISELLGVDQRTPHAWFYRKLLPEPEHPSVNGSRAWNRDTIIHWAAITGRLPVELAAEGVAALGVGEEIPVERGGREAKAKIIEQKESP